jgi:cation transport protein ChaC
MINSRPSFKTHGRITRADVETGLLEEMISLSEQQGNFRRLPEADRDISRWNTLAELPKGEDVWLYAYGSLIWSPMIEFAERRHAHLYGYHRQFSMWSKIGRGTPEFPGLTLALEPGGSNKGVAFRIPIKDVEQELKIIWNREMISGSYVPKVVKLRTEKETGYESVKAIAFIMNRTHESYAGKLAPETVANTIAHAEGPLGKCADYLFNTVTHLNELGLDDYKLSKLAYMVQAIKDRG